jgi:hypothetical protein
VRQFVTDPSINANVFMTSHNDKVTSVLQFDVKVQNVERQSVERQNVERQNINRQNVERQSIDRQNVGRQNVKKIGY